MATSRRTGQILIAALLIAAGCGGSGGTDDSLPPLLFTGATAQTVAAEALIAAGQATAGVRAPIGGLPLAVTSPMQGAAQRLVSRVVGLAPTPGPTTESCAAGGTTTTVSSSTSATVTSETVTFNNCQEDATTRVNGTLKLAVKTSSIGGTSAEFSLSVTVDLTVTVGALSFTQSGGYDLGYKAQTEPSLSGVELALTGGRLSLTVTSGAASDKLTLSNFDIDLKQDLSNTPNQQIETIDYDIDSTRLEGHISVMTNDPVKQILDAGIPHEFPHAGQVLITGATHTRLQISPAMSS